MKRKAISIILLFGMIISILSSCTKKNEDDDISELNFEVTLGETVFKADKLNAQVSGEEIAVFTRDYKDKDGNILLTIGGTHTDRAVYRVKYSKDEDSSSFTILSVDSSGNEKANTPIPVNGFTISIPLTKVNDLRIKENQDIAVNGYDQIADEYERFDLGTLIPEDKTLTRRVSYINPVAGVTDQPCITLITEDYKKEVSLPTGAVAVIVQVLSTDNYRIVSIQDGGNIPIGSNAIIFVGDYNALYAKLFYKGEDKLYISRINKVSDYSDISAIVIDEEVHKVGDEKTNLASVNESGIYLYNSYFNSLVTPSREIDFYDIVIVNDTVAYKGEKNKRIMIPSNEGVVASFVGNISSLAESLTLGDKVSTVLVKTRALPDKYLSVGGKIFAIIALNSSLTNENSCVLYTSEFGETTGTDDKGTEIIISGNAVQSVEVAKGNAIIPKDGYVLSIHNSNNMNKKAGQVVTSENVILSLAGSVYNLTDLKYNNVNAVRLTDMLILYKNKASTDTNQYGFEIIVNADGKIIGGSNKGNSQIPIGGYVLSGHGVSETALMEVFTSGANVILNEKTKTVTFLTTPMLNVENALQAYESAKTLLEKAKKEYYDIDYNKIGASLDEVSDLAEQTTAAIESSDYPRAIELSVTITEKINKLQYSMISSSAVENRAAWYRSNDKSDNEVKAAIEKAAALNINTIYLETWYNGMVTGYSDNELIKHHTKANGDFDALEAFCRIGHEYGIEIHAWVENFFIGTIEGAASNADALVNKTSGKHLLDSQGNNFNTTEYGNYVFLNPYNKSNRALVLSVYEEIIEKYDIDGIHLDYIRFPEYNMQKYDYGYNDDIIAGFQKAYKTNADPRTLIAGTAMHDNWCKFREEIINSWVKEVYNLVMNIKPNLWISCATYPNAETAPKIIFQNFSNWVEHGWIDEVFSMSYGADNSIVKENVRLYESIITDKTFYSTGLSAFGKTTQIDFAYQIDLVRGVGADGSAIFSLGSITQDNYWNAMQSGAYAVKSVQVYMLSKTISAGMSDILRKLDLVYGYNGKIKYDDLIRPLINDIKTKADAFDLENADIKQKLTYVTGAIDDLNNIISIIESNTTDSDDQVLKNALVREFNKLIEYMKQSQNRLKVRQ
ncbi:MAG: hypothetical protein A2Y15_08175 [Clostridiales bacterium GWF2_36_10]|nr:MAG: hypothetical protein A2Y15_08175 [Clostridiales bacterium GWF2_36_10]HAN21024.1 hypothetical protein [Clostridiales bacterium]